MADPHLQLDPQLDGDLESPDTLWPPPNDPSFAPMRRSERKRLMIEEAREDFRQGRYLSGEAAEEWLRRWASGEPVEVPFQD